MSSFRKAAPGILAVMAAAAVACAGLDSSGLSDDDSLGEPDSGAPLSDSGGEPPDTADDTQVVDGTTVPDAVADTRDTTTDSALDVATDVRDAADSFVANDTSDASDVRDTADARDVAEDVRDAADAAPPFCDRGDPDLLGCYRLEFTEHAIQPWDDSSYDHHGTTTGATFVAGRTGQGASVQAGSLLKIPDAPSTWVFTNKLTVEAWIQLRSFPTGVRAGVVDHNGRYGLFVLANGALRGSSLVQGDTPPLLTLATWYHVAVTYDGAVQIVYVNGIARATTQASGNIGAGDGLGLTLGSNSPSGEELDGMIDSVRIYRVARTPQQICRAAGTC